MPLLWLNFGIKDAFDILLVAFLFYYIYVVLVKSTSKSLLYGIFALLFVLFIARQTDMLMMGKIIDNFVGFGAVALVVIFQDEIRKFLFSLGSSQRWRSIRKRLFSEVRNQPEETNNVAPIVLACLNMAKKRCGALIVLQCDMDLAAYIHTGEMFTADINARLIENIFFKNSPLHDGALIIAQGKIQAAGCILPVSNSENLDKDFGLRHRSALGLSQASDAKIIIISEERGKISFAHNGIIKKDISSEELQKAIQE